MGKAAKFLLLLAGRFVGLLNQYSGAAAAYSLRSLSSSTINVVKVRRSGDDAELDFTASEVSDGTLAAWVVAGGGTEDGFVTTWYDQSGNGNNATQATASTQPKIVSSGTLVTENGKVALDFDGNDDYLSFTTLTDLSDHSIFACWGKDASNLQGALIGFSSAPDSHNFFTDGNFYTNDGVTFTNTTATQPVDQALTSIIYDSSNVIVYYNSSLDLTLSFASKLYSFNRLGEVASIQFINGKIQELIIYNSDQSANRTGIEDNINAHYNIYS